MFYGYFLNFLLRLFQFFPPYFLCIHPGGFPGQITPNWGPPKIFKQFSTNFHTYNLNIVTLYGCSRSRLYSGPKSGFESSYVVRCPLHVIWAEETGKKNFFSKFPFLAVSPTENWRKSRNSVIFGGFSVESRKVLEIS